ncbi:heavy metal-associated isoprenylated plant protein 47-like, partial [Durio zibethinus]|uniref:Heavy metal-associated isoprenylated plant protein 47-like n=1 Tax=Durio zibethinus TaxID=66656 RepID=A0A6P5WNF2_DURZI
LVQQKIIIKISMHCSKCRAKALKIAAVAEGVTSVALHGPDKDKLMIQGEDIDAACLTTSLRKKLCHAIIETIEEVKEAKKEPPKPPAPIPYCCPQPQVEIYNVVSDPSPGLCTIL